RLLKYCPVVLASSPATGSLRPAFAPRAGRPFLPATVTTHAPDAEVQTFVCFLASKRGMPVNPHRMDRSKPVLTSAVASGRPRRGGLWAARDSRFSLRPPLLRKFFS